MSRADYAHWNEDADYMWWHEEGKHIEEPPEPDDHYLGDPNQWREHDVEHDDEQDCLRDSCFSLPGATHVWECDICGQQFPQGHPEQTARR